MPADAFRRFLLAAGTAHYTDGDELASVPEDISKMVGFFGRLGYAEQLGDVRLDPSSSVLRGALSEWLNSSDRGGADTAVIYYSGHGDSQASYFYLLTADSQANRYADTALRADFVLEALGENPKVRRVLLILDTCYAGHGAFDASQVAARMWPWQDFAGDEGIWVVAAASPKQEAQERLFADAFIEAAGYLQQTTGRRQRYIGLETLIDEVNRILQRSGKRQHASWITVTQARGVAPFIPNARYEPDALPTENLETRDRLRRRPKLGQHWGLKARGAAAPTQGGWYFTGREAALAELSEWLIYPEADTRLRVLTGDPGSGKSAVMGRLVMLAATGPDAEPRGAPEGPGFTPLADVIAVALLARGKSADDLLDELAASLGFAQRLVMTETIISRPAFTVLIDAVDEAVDPPALVNELIVPLLHAASPGRGPRLLVATRRYQQIFASLPESRVTVDLDDEEYYHPSDVIRYVTKLLLAEGDPESATPYRDQPDLARSVAEQVAAIAGRCFLIAQIEARALAREPRARHPDEIAAQRERRRGIGAAFDRDLARYGENAHRVRDLLSALAWAEGVGLPGELWAPLATALSRHAAYAQEDVTWVLEHAGFYLVESLDQERSVYRLYHEQFAEYLRAAVSPALAHQRITSALLDRVPLAPDGRREWLAAAPYIRTHLATHAAAAGMLDQLASDPGFLLASDPGRLVPALATVTSQEARKSASAFESIQHGLSVRPLAEAAAQLGLSARVHDAAALAEGIGRLPLRLSWTVAWGHWAAADRHLVLGRHDSAVTAVAIGTVDGTPVAVSGGEDGTVRVWDLRAGAARGHPLAGHEGAVLAVAAGQVHGVPVAVSGGADGTVRVWDLRTAAARGEPFAINAGQVGAVAVGSVDGVPVAVSAHGRRIQMWDLRPGTSRGWTLWDNAFAVNAVAVGEVDGVPVAIWGDAKGFVSVWDLRTGKARGRPFVLGHTVHGVALSEVGGAPVAVSDDVIGVRIWDLRTRKEHRAEDLDSHMENVRFIDQRGAITCIAAGEVDGVPVAVSGGIDGHVWVRDLGRGLLRGDPFSGHTGMVSAVAAGMADAIPVAVSGGDDGTVRAWDLRSQAEPGWRDTADTGVICALGAGEVDGVPVAVSGGADGKVRVWDLRTGAVRESPFAGHDDQVWAVAAGEMDGVPVAVSAGVDGTVWVSDLRTGTATRKPLLRKRPRRREWRRALSWAGWLREVAVAVCEVDGVPVALASVFDRDVRVWDLRTGAERGKLRTRFNGAVYAVAAGQVDGVPVAVSGGEDGFVWIWDLRRGAVHSMPLAPVSFPGVVSAVAVGEAEGVPIAVSAHGDRGVRVWDLRTGALRGEPLTGHSGTITTVALGHADGVPVAVSGDDDGTVLVWNLDGSQHRPVRLDAPAGVNAIAYGGRAGWLTATSRGRDLWNVRTEKGSLFAWSPVIGADSLSRRG